MLTNVASNEGTFHIPRAVMHAALRDDCLNICHMNVQSICSRKLSKFNEFKSCFQDGKVDLICLTETWLTNDISDGTIGLDGFKLLRNDRIYGRGGGIGLYFRDNLGCKTVSASDLSVRSGNACTTEFLFVEISSGANKFLIGIFYNPPRVDCSDIIYEKLSEYVLKYRHIVLLGDFNINVKLNNSMVNRFRNVFDHFGFSCVGSEPTHFHSGGSSQIDLIFTNDSDFILNFNQVSGPGFSAHDIIFSSLNVARSSLSNTISYRDYNCINMESLNNALSTIDWSILYSISDSNIALDYFNSIILTLFNDFVPIRSRRSSKCNKWFNNEICRAMVERDLAYRIWKRTKNQLDRDQYKRLRNNVTTLINQAKSDYISRSSESSHSNNVLWKKLKDINVSKSSAGLHFNNSCDEINDYFASNFTFDDCFPRLPPPNENGFRFTTTNEFEIHKMIDTVTSNAIGPDGVPLKFIKLILPFVITPIAHIFNTIILTCKYPRAWKFAKILPIRKKARGCDLGNLRPISILSALSKVFEKILKNQMLEFLNSHNLLTDVQSGFRAGHNTTCALLKVHDDIHKSIDRRGVAFLLLIDFSKAFDSVSHSRLLRKLSDQFNFSSHAVYLLQSYLTNRSQQVAVDGNVSSFIQIISGVPQGSVLGPLLFTLFINDLPSVLQYCSIHMFADDVQIYLHSCSISPSEMAQLINTDLSNIFNWSCNNMLPINASKTKIMYISRSRQPRILPVISLGGVSLTYVNKASNLGVIFQDDLEWDAHINAQCGKIYGALKHLKLTANMVSSDIKLKLFKSLILPHFLYGIELLLNASARALDRMRVALNYCVRWVFSLSRFTSVSQIQYKLLGCSFHNFIKLRSCITLFKIIKSSSPLYLFNKLHLFRSTRICNFVLPQYTTSHYGDTFFVRGVVSWNQLPLEIRSIDNFSRFRSECTEFFNRGN